MQFAAILNILGTLLVVFSLSMFPPIFVNGLYHENAFWPFFASMLITFSTGFVLKCFFRKKAKDLKSRDGFLIVVLFWVVLGSFSALPFLFSFYPDLSVTDAFFESVSGITTTGATVLSNLHTIPRAILYYRQQLEFLGGMGIIVLALAILPILGIGGMQLYRAEMPGPIKDEKITPRITETAKMLWYIYVGLMLICAFLFWSSGMSLFDAICESFGTVSTGGFSIHDESFGFYHSVQINLICMVFMVLGSVNFALHVLALRKRSLKPYFRDMESRTYLTILLCISIVIALGLYVFIHESISVESFVSDAFDVVSVMSSTGFTSSDFSTWPRFLPVLMMVIGVIGGCAASTSGGIKVMRFLLMYKQAGRALKYLIHPEAIIPIRIGKRILSEDIIQGIWGFISIYILLYIVLILCLMATGLDLATAFGALTASISNLGASIGDVAGGYGHLNVASKWILVFAMLAGRLEIFSLFVLFSPSFWRR